MIWEAVAAAAVGALVLWLVLQPLVTSAPTPAPAAEPVDPEETPKGLALLALKEIEFDRATGKLSDADYEALKAKYTVAAVEAMRAEAAAPTAPAADDVVEAMIAARARARRAPDISGPPSCPTCGPRPEPDAVFCSTCGLPLPTSTACATCGAPLRPDGHFCERCGTQVAA